MRLQLTAQLAAKNHASKLGLPHYAAAEVSYKVHNVAAASSAQLKRLPLGRLIIHHHIDFEETKGSLNKIIVVLFCLLLIACSSVNLTQPTLIQQTARRPTKDNSEFISGLSNAEYPLEVTSTGKVKLTSGLFEEPVAPGSASKLQVHLGKEQAFGDINIDGQTDAIVCLYVDSGGSGMFVYFSLVLNQNGKPSPIASYLLGDRIQIKSLLVEPNNVLITILDRKDSEPMSSAPSVEKVKQYKFQNNQLLQVK